MFRECIAEVGPDGNLRLRKEAEIRTLAVLVRETEKAELDAAVELEKDEKALQEVEVDLRLTQKRAKARVKRRQIVSTISKRPQGYVELYIPPESRKATRVGSRPRDHVAANVPNTTTWLLDGMVGLSPADSSMLWHVQGVPAVYTAQQMEQHHSNAARMSKRVKAARIETPKRTQNVAVYLKDPVGPIQRDVSGVKLVRSTASQKSETGVSNPGDDEPSSPSGGPTLTFATTAKNKAKRPPSGLRRQKEKLAYSNVYMPLATGMSIGPRQRGPLRMNARGCWCGARTCSCTGTSSDGAKRPATAPAVVSAARKPVVATRYDSEDAVQHFLQPSDPKTAGSPEAARHAERLERDGAHSPRSSPPDAAKSVTLKSVKASVEGGDAEGKGARKGGGTTVSQHAESLFARLDQDAETQVATSTEPPVVERAGPPTEFLVVPGGVWSARASTAPQRSGAPKRVDGALLRERSKQSTTATRPGSARPPSRPPAGGPKGSKVEMMVLAGGADLAPKTQARCLDVSNGQAMTSIISAPVGDSTSPISPSTRLRRAQAACSHYFADNQGRARHIAVDMSTRVPGGKNARAEPAGARTQKRPSTARQPHTAPSPPAKGVSQTARPSTAGHRRVQTSAVSMAPVLGQGAALLPSRWPCSSPEWQVGGSKPAWSRGQTGWGGRGGSAGVIRSPVVRMSKMQANVSSRAAAVAAPVRRHHKHKC